MMLPDGCACFISELRAMYRRGSSGINRLLLPSRALLVPTTAFFDLAFLVLPKELASNLSG